jgi:hypothetical protein
MRPIKTRNGLERISLLNGVKGPAAISRKVPRVGSIASHPGNKEFLSISRVAINIKRAPEIEIRPGIFGSEISFTAKV